MIQWHLSWSIMIIMGLQLDSYMLVKLVMVIL
jgi:hypothetical protein